MEVVVGEGRPHGRIQLLKLQSQTFEEERILAALERVLREGGRITLENEEFTMKCHFEIDAEEESG